MFRPFLVVGIGGSGGKTLRAARQALQSKLDLQGWEGGWPQAWQLLHIDSSTTPDGLEFPAPVLPQEDFLSLVPSGVGYRAIHDKVLQGLSATLTHDVQRSLPAPDDFPQINSSAPDMRAIGRTIAMGAMKEIHDKVRGSLVKMQSTSADAELKEITRLFGAEVSASQTPTVIVISSVAGLSGSGMFIDVAEVIKAAIGPKEWAHRIFSMLFAPDVFEEIGPGMRGRFSGNAMGALAELISGFWRSAPTEGTLALYKKHGLSVPQDTRSTIGPAFNYIIGRKNGNANPVDFGSQVGVYTALANTLAAWMTDAVIQDDLSVYSAATSRSASLMDNTQLATISATQPLSSLGFARVSVGTDKFFEYAAERLAKQTLETLLRQHILTAPMLPGQTEEEWVEHFTNLSEGAFISESGLDELAEEDNQVVDALAPDTAELQERFKRAISTAMAGEIPAGGLSHEEWTSLMVRAYEAILPNHLEDLSKLVQEKARDWVQKMPEKILTLVTQTASRQGLFVTVKLLERLIQRTMAAAEELIKQQPVHAEDSGAIRHTVAQVMEPTAAMGLVPSDHPTIAQALSKMELAMNSALMADIETNAGELVVDFSDNFLEPLRLTLWRGYFALKDATAYPKLPDNTPNPYENWPDFTQEGVDRHLLPAPNESMLIDIEDFPSEFDTLVKKNVNDSTVAASRIVIEEIVMGSKSGEVSKLRENQQWDILTVKQAWIPKNPDHQISEASNQPAVFAVVIDHMEYLGFAKKWIKIPGRAFRAFLDQTIPLYLQADGNQEVQNTRSKKFAAAISSSIHSAGPLVELDQQLLAATHGSVEVNMICSGIPIDKSDPLREGIDNILVNNGYDPARGWYISGSKASHAKSIEILTQLTSAITPIPMSSLMRPIHEEWCKASSNYSNRSNFMQWRRGRTLAEAIPAHPEQWQAMLNGWFVGRMLNLFALDKSEPSYQDVGPRLSIWVDPAAGWVDFPYPLHTARIARNVDDFPAIVLDSLIVAMANCHAATSLKPLVPYQRLLDLGGSRGTWKDLSRWILDGEVQFGAPTPDPSRAGSPSGSSQERQDVCATYLEDVLVKFRQNIAGLDPHADSRTYPIAWELRSEIEHALDTGINAVRSIEPEVHL